MKAANQPKFMDKEHITALDNLLNESWQKLKIDVFNTNRINELFFLLKTRFACQTPVILEKKIQKLNVQVQTFSSVP